MKCSFLFFTKASLLAGQVEDARFFGWRTGFTGASTGDGAEGDNSRPTAHDWKAMVVGVQNYIKGLNFKYLTDLRSKGVRSCRETMEWIEYCTVVLFDCTTSIIFNIHTKYNISTLIPGIVVRAQSVLSRTVTTTVACAVPKFASSCWRSCVVMGHPVSVVVVVILRGY